MILKSKITHLTIVVLVVMSGALVDAVAGTIHPDVATASLSRGSVYGINADEQSGPATFILSKVGREELNAYGGIQTEEINLLGAEAYLPSLNALELTQAVTATDIAGTGKLSNNHRAHAPVWNPIVANIGFQNLNGISLAAQYISPPGFHTPNTTTQRKPPRKNRPIAVPDQSNSLLLLGMGLGSLGLVEYRRKRA